MRSLTFDELIDNQAGAFWANPTVDAMETLMVTLPNERRPAFLLEIRDRQTDVGTAVYQAAFVAVWQHDHALMADAMRDDMAEMAQEAGFVSGHEGYIYRGGLLREGFDIERLAEGWSWTKDPDMAVFFARDYWGTRISGASVVLRRWIWAGEAMLENDDRTESEILMDQDWPPEPQDIDVFDIVDGKPIGRDGAAWKAETDKPPPAI